jgi:hypothetical protein
MATIAPLSPAKTAPPATGLNSDEARRRLANVLLASRVLREIA